MYVGAEGRQEVVYQLDVGEKFVVVEGLMLIKMGW